MSTRLSVNINTEVAAAVRELAERQDVTVTEVVRRSVSIYYYFRQQKAAGRYVQLKALDGSLARVELP